MGYTPTTNYGFQKPEKTNPFTVDDLNNALDAIDSKVKEDITTSVEDGVDSVTLSSLGMSLDGDGNLSISVSDKSGHKVSASQNILSAQGNLVFTGDLTDATMTITMIATGKQLYSGNVVSQEIATGSGTINVAISKYGHVNNYELQVSGPTPLDITEDIVTITPPSGIISWSYNGYEQVNTSPIDVLKQSSSTTVSFVYGQWDDGSNIVASNTITPTVSQSVKSPDHSDYYAITNSRIFKIPKTGMYQIICVSGGGGGGGGAWYSLQSSTNDIDFNGGAGGNGGGVAYYANTKSYDENTSVNVTIGSGGEGGKAAESATVNGTKGGDGGATLFDTATSGVGKGGDYARYYAGLGTVFGGDGGTGGGFNGGYGESGGEHAIYETDGSLRQSGTSRVSGTSNANSIYDYTTRTGSGGSAGSAYHSGTAWRYINGGSGGDGATFYGIITIRGGGGGRGGGIAGGGIGSIDNNTTTAVKYNPSDGYDGANGAVFIRLEL